MNEDERAWEEMLSEPMTLVRDAGWRQVCPLEEVSPRPQLPPAVLPDAESWVMMPRLPQPESPAEDPVPPTLAEQLSLTWAVRRRARAAAAAEEEIESTYEEPPPAPQPESVSTALPRPGRTRFRPLQQVLRLLGRNETGEPATHVESAPPSTLGDEAAPAQPSPRKRPDEISTSQPEREDAGGDQSPPRTDPPRLPLVLHAQSNPQPLERDEPPGKMTPKALPEPPRGDVAHELTASKPGPVVEQRVPRQGPDVAGEPLFRALARRLPRRHRDEVEPVSTEGERNDQGPTDAPDPPTPPALVLRQATGMPEPASGPAVALEDGVQASGAAKEPAPAPDPGEPLSPVLRERMAGLIDLPLREVRVFRNVAAARVTSAMRADAVSTGGRILVGPGEGNPGTPAGQALIAHELAHIAAAEPPVGEAPGEHDEERALALEHAVARQAYAAPRAEPAAGATLPELAHARRAGPTSGPVAVDAPGWIDMSAPGFDGGRARTLGASAPMVVARAPEDRPAPPAEPAPVAQEAVAEPPVEDKGRQEQDEAGLIERVVDAVLHQMRRQSDVENERRGAFRSGMGG
ncbi:MAG TPA: DUF4157 domain-containing protein [Dehalococcoidia bacterium]